VNRGPGGARNAGIEVARGRWIAVLDSDDEILPQRTAAMIASAGRMGAQIVVDNLQVVTPGKPIEVMFQQRELQKREMLTLSSFIDSNVLFRSTFNFGYMKPMFERAFLTRLNLRFHEGLRIGEDYLLLASALASGGRCAIEPSVGYVYHIREGSISRVLEPHHVRAMIEADRSFVANYPLDALSAAAQMRRNRSLVEAGAFLSLVDAIKKKSVFDCLRIAIAHPAAVRHLKMPIAARMRGVINPLPWPGKASS
jgi:succinoglycan biosynthesis protein ExoO